MSTPPAQEPSTKKGLAHCAAHGLVYDVATQAGCVLCRKSRAPSEASGRPRRVEVSVGLALLLAIGGVAWLAAGRTRREPSRAADALDAGAAAAVAAMPSDSGSPPVRSQPEPPRTGAPIKATLALTRRAPLSSLAEIQRRIGYADADVSEPDEDYLVAAESFNLYVPASYRAEQPAGLLVWIDAGDVPVLPPEYEAVLEQQGVLWAAARRSGNYRKPPVRVNLALDIAADVQSRYQIDRRRVWVGGFSGGARSASKAALLYPEVFTGGLFMGGADYVREVGPDGTGRRWPSTMPRPDPQRVAASKPHGFVLIVGDHDPNRDYMLQVHREYLRDGFRNATLAVVPGMGHSLPSDALFATLLARLSGG
jgi:predicted esterase